jgi:hypothetical protein
MPHVSCGLADARALNQRVQYFEPSRRRHQIRTTAVELHRLRWGYVEGSYGRLNAAKIVKPNCEGRIESYNVTTEGSRTANLESRLFVSYSIACQALVNVIY